MNKILSYVLLLLVGFGSSGYAESKDTLFINQLINQSVVYSSEQADSGFILARQALRYSKEINYLSGVEKSCMLMGSYYNNIGRNDSAIRYVNEALQLRLKSKNHKGAASCYLRLSYIHKDLNNKDARYEALLRSIREAISAKDTGMQISVNIELGNASVDFKDTLDAKHYFHEALYLSQLFGDENLLRNSYAGLGNFYYNYSSYADTALIYFLKENELFRSEDEPILLSENLNNIGLAYSALRQYNQAKVYYFKALDLSRGFENKNNVALVLHNLGGMFNKMNLPDSAIEYLNQSYVLARTLNDLSLVSTCLDLLANAYMLKGNYQRSYEFLTQFINLNDTLNDYAKNKNIEDAKKKYETELKDEKLKSLNEKIYFEKQQKRNILFGTISLLLFLVLVLFLYIKIRHEKKRSELLLLNILPSDVAEELKETGEAIAKHYDHVTVLFTDFVNFTKISEQMTPTELVAEIHRCFTAFDEISERNQLEKIKTIGDAYLAVCGLPHQNQNHAIHMVQAGLEIRDWLQQYNTRFQIRIGIHTGPVVAGIVGKKKFAYDIWGDTVNIASRMESSGQPGKINISGSTYELVKDAFECEYRGKVMAKNKGEIDMYFVEKKGANDLSGSTPI